MTGMNLFCKGSDYEKVPKAPKKTDQPMTDPKPVFTRKENATLAQRIEILGYHANGKTNHKRQSILTKSTQISG